MKTLLIVLLVIWPLVACTAEERMHDEPIGTATMRPDGTLVLKLRAESGTTIGDAILEYGPDHPQYQSVKRHLGGIEPGEEKPVPPWPDQQPPNG